MLPISAFIRRPAVLLIIALTFSLGFANSVSAQKRGKLEYDVDYGAKRDQAAKWTSLVERFSSASPDLGELLRNGDEAFNLHMSIGENALGVIQDPGSTSQFYSGDFYPRMMA